MCTGGTETARRDRAGVGASPPSRDGALGEHRLGDAAAMGRGNAGEPTAAMEESSARGAVEEEAAEAELGWRGRAEGASGQQRERGVLKERSREGAAGESEQRGAGEGEDELAEKKKRAVRFLSRRQLKKICWRAVAEGSFQGEEEDVSERMVRR